MSGDRRVVPDVTDRDQAGFWDAARRGELAVEVCVPAGHVLHPARGYCSTCDTFDVTWRAVSGRAHVHTWTVVEHSVDPDFPAPYAIVLVELDDVPGVRFVTSLPGRPELDVRTPMEVRFERVDDEITVPTWVLVRDRQEVPA